MFLDYETNKLLMQPKSTALLFLGRGYINKKIKLRNKRFYKNFAPVVYASFTY